MWNYEKRLQFPVNIKEPNARLATVIMSQYGGPDGEMGASMRYLSQRYAMPYKEVSGLLTDIGTEELAHLEWWLPLYTSLQETFPWRKSKPVALLLTTRITLSASGPRLLAVCPSMPVSSKVKATLSPIYLRIWLRNRKPARPMTISCA